MIRARYLTSRSDLSDCFLIRGSVFPGSPSPDEYDKMAVYALAVNEDDAPVGVGRLYIDAHDHFRIDCVGVLEHARGQGYGDLITRMLLFRSQELNAPEVWLSATPDTAAFFSRYGLVRLGEGFEMRVSADQINLEGTCGGLRRPSGGQRG